jgi:hypothetical protein
MPPKSQDKKGALLLVATSRLTAICLCDESPTCASSGGSGNDIGRFNLFGRKDQLESLTPVATTTTVRGSKMLRNDKNMTVLQHIY